MDPLDGTSSKAEARPAARSSPRGIAADLIAVLVAVTSGEPRVLTIRDQRALPSGPFELAHRSLQAGLRAWVERQTRLPLGYVEQLYTFADRDRAGATDQHAISISYLGLTREHPVFGEHDASWCGWYDYFPWEDHRVGTPPLIKQALQPGLQAWASSASDRAAQRIRRQRAAMLFGFEGHAWNEELVLQRYELLYEARLVPEALRGNSSQSRSADAVLSQTPGKAMILDHRRILATGMARLRAKIKYHPVVFELMPDTFTLLQLQRCVEALAGRQVHKPNFRRLIAQQELIEETGETSQDGGGRPAKLFRFRGAVFAERAIAGTKLPITRT